MRYLVHFFDANEHLRRSEALVCTDESEAVAEAAARPHPHVIEVWLGERRIWRDDRRTVFAFAS
jgi:hypothetical protein